MIRLESSVRVIEFPGPVYPVAPRPYFDNPWFDAVPVPVRLLAEAHLGVGVQWQDGTVMTADRLLQGWRQYGAALDGYILPGVERLSAGVRFSNKEADYLSLICDDRRLRELLLVYGGRDAQRATAEMYR